MPLRQFWMLAPELPWQSLLYRISHATPQWNSSVATASTSAAELESDSFQGIRE